MEPTTNATALRVSRLQERDYKRIEYLDLTPAREGLVILRGPNEAGKTSAIDAMRAALEGARSDPDVPIRSGADRALVIIDLADDDGPRYQIEVRWTAKGRYLALRDVTGDRPAKLGKAQSHLADIVGVLAFDPLRFMRADAKTQVQMLLEAVGKKGEWDILAAQRRDVFDRRTNVTRDLRSTDARLETTHDPMPSRRVSAVNLGELTDHLAAIADATAVVQRKVSERDRLRNQRDDLVARVDGLRDAIARLELERTEAAELTVAAESDVTRISLEIEGLPEIDDADDVRRQIRDAETTNETARIQESRRRMAEEFANLSATKGELTAQLDEIDADALALLDNADLGVSGLRIDIDNVVLHDDVPIDQASGMRQLEISTMIGMAANDRLRVMTIDEGDRLDPESLERLDAIAKARGYQVWMTAVYAGGDGTGEVHEVADGRAGTPAGLDVDVVEQKPGESDADFADRLTG